jgi:hypothetical protein
VHHHRVLWIKTAPYSTKAETYIIMEVRVPIGTGVIWYRGGGGRSWEAKLKGGRGISRFGVRDSSAWQGDAEGWWQASLGEWGSGMEVGGDRR